MERRPRGTGSIVLRKDGLWVGRFRGKAVYGRTKSEASAKLAELVAAGGVRPSSMKLDAFLDGWLAEKETVLKPATAKAYRSAVANWILPELGGLKVSEVTPLDVERVERRILDAGRTPATARNAFRVLSSALRDAERVGLTARNPCHAARAPQVRPNPRPAIPPAHLKAIFEANADDPYLTRFMLALFTAGRQGEILGLELDRLHLDGPAPYVELTRSLQRVSWRHGCPEDAPCGRRRGVDCPQRGFAIPAGHDPEQVAGGLWLLTPKSATSARPIALMPTMVDALRLWVSTMRPVRFVFERDGRPVSEKEDLAAWRAMQVRAGIGSPYPVHSLRHTAATMMAEAGIDERTRIAVMGHSSADMTAYYTHREVAQQHAALGALEAGFAGVVDAGRPGRESDNMPRSPHATMGAEGDGNGA